MDNSTRSRLKSLATRGDDVGELFAELTKDRIVTGLFAEDPATPSSQATGAAGNTLVKSTVEKGRAVINGVVCEYVGHDSLNTTIGGSQVPNVNDGILVPLVVYTDGTDNTLYIAQGGATKQLPGLANAAALYDAVHDPSQWPTRAEIDEAIKGFGGTGWVLVGCTGVIRIGDTTLQQYTTSTYADVGLL